MKRYLLFAGSRYYPKGGHNDFIIDADDSRILQRHWEDNKEIEMWDWMHILDTQEGKIIEQQYW